MLYQFWIHEQNHEQSYSQKEYVIADTLEDAEIFARNYAETYYEDARQMRLSDGTIEYYLPFGPTWQLGDVEQASGPMAFDITEEKTERIRLGLVPGAEPLPEVTF